MVKTMMKLFCEKLNEENLFYQIHEENNVVTIGYSGKNFKSLTFAVIFDDDGSAVSIKAYSIATFKKNQLEDAYKFCNEMNTKYRWVKFYVDDDNELTASSDAIITKESIAEECIRMLALIISIVDSACEVLYS